MRTFRSNTPIRVLLALLALLVMTVLAGPGAFARPTIRQSFFNAYPGAVGSKLDDVPSHLDHCGVCHYDFSGGGPRNPYGVRLGDVIGNFPNNDAGRQQAIHSIENEDSDGDAFTQLTEITNTATYSNTPTFPGLTPSNVGGVSNVVVNELLNYLVPQIGGDTQPPTVTLTAPNGGEGWAGGSGNLVTWTATDNIAVTSVDLFYRDSESAIWTMIARNLSNSGSFLWFVQNTPTASARVRILARDAAGNQGEDMSNGLFTVIGTAGGIVPTTLRDFDQPGTQPFGGGTFEQSTACITCHGGYDTTVEPGHAFKRTMIAQVARDPLFYACLAIAEQDAPSSGDLCLRCHTPFGWLSGRSQPTDGSQLIASDRDGVACDFCHRAVDPIYVPGVSPPEDQAVLSGLLPAHTPTGYSNGQFVIDPNPRKRGPFTDPVAPHAFLASPFHRSSAFCGTCHDVSNPVFARVSGADYAPGALDQAAGTINSSTLMPLERTYSEWLNSAFPAGVFAPEFAGNKPDGIVSTCQDCHLRDVSGKGCNDPTAPTRADLPFHDMTGGNAWLPALIASLYPTETDPGALAASAVRAVGMLQKAAILDISSEAEATGYRASVLVTNRTGHKLPTGYPEGRRMWLHVVARNAADQIVYESGFYDAATGVLTQDPNLVVYEAHLGLSPSFGGAIGLPHGPSFHFALNDTIYKDNRIPPQGFTNSAFASFGGEPVDDTRPAPRYPDGQNWDTAVYHLPQMAATVKATLYYQTTSKEYVEFLRDANTTNSAGQVMHDLWAANGRAAPVTMAADSFDLSQSVSVSEQAAAETSLHPMRNPFRDVLELSLTLKRPESVAMEVFDVRGRRIAWKQYGILGGGAHRLTWDGKGPGGAHAAAGTYWARVQVGREALVTPVVRAR